MSTTKITPLALVTLGAILTLAAPAPAAIRLGSADSTAAPTSSFRLARAMGSSVSRVLLDPGKPLEAYDPVIAKIREAGLRPQLVVGGFYNGGWHGVPATIFYAGAAVARWPDTYAVSLTNEPELSWSEDGPTTRPGVIGRLYRKGYWPLHRMGVKVLLGELSPCQGPKTLRRMGRRIVADGIALHAYDNIDCPGSLRNLGKFNRRMRGLRDRMHTPAGRSLPVYVTEFGYPTRGSRVQSDERIAELWPRALRTAVRHHVREVVAYHITEAPATSWWDTSLVRSDGQPRPAFWRIARFMAGAS